MIRVDCLYLFDLGLKVVKLINKVVASGKLW